MELKKLLVHAQPRSEHDPAMAMAVRLAKRYGATVTLIDVTPDTSWPLQYLTGSWEETIENISGSKESALGQLTASLRQQVIQADYVMTHGRLSVAIIREVLSGQHDLVVKVAEGDGANRSGFLGSTDVRLLRKCPCPILILRDDDRLGFQQVAAALDIMDNHEIQRKLDDRVLQAAHQLCEGRLHLLYAMPSIPEIIQVDVEDSDLVSAEQLIEWNAALTVTATEKLATLQQSLAPQNVEYHVLPDRPADAIPEFVNAHGVDLLVMGSVARSGIDGLLIGNTAEHVLNCVCCSVLALKPDTFVSPITLTDQLSR